MHNRLISTQKSLLRPSGNKIDDPTSGNPLVQEYRDPDRLRSAIPHADRLKDLPSSPFIGELSYRSVINLLADQQRWFTPPERKLIEDLNEYLTFKLSQLRTTNGHGHN